jgi:hypothetical protein
MRPWIIALVVVLVLNVGLVRLSSSIFAQDVSADAQSAIDQILRAQEPLKVPYANAHLKFEVVSRVDEESKRFKEEFWSRDGTFYRVDSESVKIIVRPEGFAALSNSGQASEDAVTAFGSMDEGMDRLFGYVSFHSSLRMTGNGFVTDLLVPVAKRQPGFTLKSFVRHEDTIELKIEWKYEGGRNLYTLSFEDTSFACVGAETVIESENKPRVVLTDTRVIDSQTLLPRTIAGKRVSSDGHETSFSMTAIVMEQSPAPISVFEIGGAGLSSQSMGTSVWTRRMLVLVSGIVFLGFYFYLRRRRRSRTKK